MSWHGKIQALEQTGLEQPCPELTVFKDNWTLTGLLLTNAILATLIYGGEWIMDKLDIEDDKIVFNISYAALVVSYMLNLGITSTIYYLDNYQCP